ncbi:SDR family NAD(P)-dependent oxidoreductase [Catenovulum agarivorans]|uniref:SDR family NAD(P)-dependent oxidoreductase n=1 Tax=Catenovulum agarivorans TaxID=1172192 RepID=UPI0002F3D444|nr:SDR family oxidoreductase [Catenovulum agarivorans]
MLNKKIILITGGGNGLGLGMVDVFVSLGAFVIAVDIDEKAAAKLQKYNRLKQSVDFVRVDISSSSEVLQLKNYIVDKYHYIDGLVNNAAKMHSAGFFDSTLEEFDSVINLNLKSVFYMSQAFSKLMSENRKGAIVNVSSTHTKATLPGHEIYAACKAGIAGLTRSMALSLGKHGVRVNTLSPGLIETDKIVKHINSTPGLTKAYSQMSPTNQNNSVADVANVAAFLLSDNARAINGADIVVDQGESVQAYNIEQFGICVRENARCE